MRLGIFLLVTGSLVTNAFGGSDAFDGVRCGSDIPKALTGKRMSNQRVADLEKRHADLGLKDLGGDEISEHLSTTSWLICGSEFLLLEDESFVRDVLRVPPHSKTSPFFIGSCELNGKESKDILVAILDNEKAIDASALTAKVAWKSIRRNRSLLAFRSKVFAVRAAA